MNTYVIGCVNDDSVLWSNAWGWSEGDDFDVFSAEEKEKFSLPLEGFWLKLVTII